MFTVNMVNRFPGPPFEINEVKISGPEMYAGYMVLDTGCQRTCCGSQWVEAHTLHLKEFGLHPKMLDFPDSFKFGKGTPLHATTKGYYPSAIGGQPLLLASSTLNEQIPFLASNSLLTGLGAVFNLVNDTIVFKRLGGAKAKIYRLGGHMAICISDFQTDEPSRLPVWKELSDDAIWENPHPEFILSSQIREVSLPKLASLLADVPSTTDMVEGLEADGASAEEHGEGHHLANGASSQAWTDEPRSSTCTTTSAGDERKPADMHSWEVSAVRQRPRQVRDMSAVRPQVGMEQRPQQVGGSSSEGRSEGWVKRTLYALATIAGTLFADNSGIIPSSPSGNIEVSGQAGSFEDRSSSHRLSPGGSMDQLLRHGLQAGPLDGVPVPGGLQCDGAGPSLHAHSPQLLRGSLLLRRDLQAGQTEDVAGSRHEKVGAPGGAGRGEFDHRGRRGLRLGGSGSTPMMKKGTEKRLRGLWSRSAKTLEAENKVYVAQKSFKERPPPSVDLWELFAGRALCSELANEYDLEALQPWDLIYGQDLMTASTRSRAFEVLDNFKPLLVMLEIDCRHYNLFNKNLNYSHRPEVWQELQEEDRPLLTFTAKVAKKQWEASRFFFIENPQRSELWSMPEIRRLASLHGVYEFVLDSGAFGATIDGKPVIKPFKILTNLPGLDEVLQRRLSQQQRALCTPIEGAATRQSQEYPEEMCRELLQHLRNYVAQTYPSRFCIHQALPVQLPTDDLAQWDDIIEQINNTMERTSKRPYYIQVDSAMGKKIQDLFRLDAIRIQVVSSPTTRRIPSNVDEYYTRAAFLLYNDDTKSVEVEDLGELQYPRQRFTKPVRYAVFAYGHRRSMPEASAAGASTLSPTTVPNLPTDIDFPGISVEIPQEIRSSVARLHLNLGHPSRQELCRFLAYEGSLPDAVYDCARRLRCATCERLKPKQPPRPSGKPSMVVGQFGDELQMDVFYCRTLTSETFIVLGMVDKATGLQQAIILPDRSGDSVFEAFEKAWLRPYGLPIHVSCDPDPSFRGSFEARTTALGCIIEHCPAEAHWVIGMVERRNALLRTILEKLIDQFAAATINECSTLLVAACHAINSNIHTHGRSAYQAVFGRQPRLVNSNFNDPMVLATSEPAAGLNSENSAAYKAEFVRCEALKALHQLDCSQHLRRALLRKTRATKIADLQPGQACAFWRWTRRGAKKRGSWKMGRFLSWDPSHVGKQAWIRTGGSTTLVTAEQLRGAFGFEDWSPSPDDIKALKDASSRFTALLDDRGAPPGEQALDDDDVEETFEDDVEINPEPIPASMMVPLTPPELLGGQPSTPPLQSQPPINLPPQLPQPAIQQQQQNIQQQQTINVHVDSPTHVTQQQYHRYGTLPATPRRYRSRTPVSQRDGGARRELAEHQQRIQDAEQPALESTTPELLLDEQYAPQQHQPVSQAAESAVQQASEQQLAAPSEQQAIDVDNVQVPVIDLASQEDQQLEPSQVEVSQDQQQVAAEDPYQQPLPQLPQKRTFDEAEIMFTLIAQENGTFSRPHAYWDGSPALGFGPAPRRCHMAYLASQQRREDLADSYKDHYESDTTQGSDTGEKDNETQIHKQGLSRMELKALDREIPWRRIAEMPQQYQDRFLEAINKEAESWSTWQSVQPLSDQEAEKIFRDPVLGKRVLRSRACYRDKSLGVGEIRPKCRVVALGHLDPDLGSIHRNSATPGRLAEHYVYGMIVAGHNCELFGSKMPWQAWLGDAATAFLQGRQSDRVLPLYLLPPKDGLIAQTNTWQHKLYRIRGNIYGLANAPYTWYKEVLRRLQDLQYQQHSFDKQFFYKTVGDEVVSIVLVYVDDFIGVHRQDYCVDELHSKFKRGSLSSLKLNEPATFKGKELTLQLNEEGRYVMRVTMKKFINGLDSGSLPRGRLQADPELSPSEQKELRSVSGCLQWAATQTRPEIAATVSLTAHGAEAKIQDLKNLYSTIGFLKETSDRGILTQDVPINKQTLLIGYSDASWANAKKSGSQIGALVGLTTSDAMERPAKMILLDWKSSRSVRVCRSTLAAEASAGDEVADRSSFANLFLSELLYLQPAHRVGNRVSWVQATDAKSLYDAVVSENPNLTDKRTLVSIRAIQETTSGEQMHWLPTRFQFSDGLTKIDEKLRASFSAWLQQPWCILVDHPDNGYFEELFFGRIFGSNAKDSGTKNQQNKDQ